MFSLTDARQRIAYLLPIGNDKAQNKALLYCDWMHLKFGQGHDG